jgi:hypothetical protein
MACGNNHVSWSGLRSSPQPTAHPMIETPTLWTKHDPRKGDRLDIFVATRSIFDPSDKNPHSYDWRGAGHRELAKAIAADALVNKSGEKPYAHLIGRVEGQGRDAVLVLSLSAADRTARDSNLGLTRGPGVAGGVVKGWVPRKH